MPILMFVAWLAILSAWPALAHFADHEQWAQLTPDQRDWLLRQRIPGTDYEMNFCCHVADAEQVEEDIVNGHYRVRSATTAGLWVDIPDDVVIRTPNKYGQPVVWWKFIDGLPVVRCYAPGSGM